MGMAKAMAMAKAKGKATAKVMAKAITKTITFKTGAIRTACSQWQASGGLMNPFSNELVTPAKHRMRELAATYLIVL